MGSVLLPSKIFLTGLMGSGKSYWGRQLAGRLHIPFLDLDKGIELAERCSVATLFAEKGEAHFRQVERDVLQTLIEQPRFVMSCGGGTPCYFDNLERMKQCGTVLWLHPSLPVLADRLMPGRYKRPLLHGAQTENDIIQILEGQLEKRISFYRQADYLITEEHPTFETFEKILLHA